MIQFDFKKPFTVLITSEKLIRFLFNLFIIVIFGGLIANVFSNAVANRIEEIRSKNNQAIRSNLHGFWMFRTKIKFSDSGKYNNLEIFDRGALTVNEDFGVTGIIYRWKQKEVGVEEFIFDFAKRRRSDVTGSIIGNDVLLNSFSKNNENTESVDIYQGYFVGKDLIKGHFFGEYDSLFGDFCAQRVSFSKIAINMVDCKLN